MSDKSPAKDLNMQQPRFVVPLMIVLLVLTPCALGTLTFVTCFKNFRLH